MTHQKTKYLCNFCNREYAVAVNAQKHEISCYHNPDQEACATCANLRTFQADEEGPQDYDCAVGLIETYFGLKRFNNHCGQWKSKDGKK